MPSSGKAAPVKNIKSNKGKLPTINTSFAVLVHAATIKLNAIMEMLVSTAMNKNTRKEPLQETSPAASRHQPPATATEAAGATVVASYQGLGDGVCFEDELDPRQEYDLRGIVAHVMMKENGQPKKVVRLERGR